METAESVINDALQEILVQSSEQPVLSVDFETGKRYLNRMMAAWDVKGMPLGYTKVNSPNDPITVSDGVIEAIIFNLAFRLATSYDIPVSATLLENAKEGLRTVEQFTRQIFATQHPSTLPIGSGNEWYGHRSRRFYPGEQEEILTEQEGSILLEPATNDTSQSH